MSPHVPLASLSALNPPPPDAPFAVLKAYLDDSGDETDRQHTAVALAGYIGTARAWEAFEEGWGRALREFEAPYLHMKEFAHSLGAFASWKGEEDRRRAFLGRCCSVIAEAGLHGIGAVVRFADLGRFNADHGTRIEPMPLAIYFIMLEIYHRDPDHWVEMWLDGMKLCEAKLATAIRYARSARYDDVSHIITAACEKRPASVLRPLQAADFAAYEALKFERTPRAAFADGTPKRRGSFNALLDAAPLEGMVVDYETLRQVHDWRGGDWERRPFGLPQRPA